REEILAPVAEPFRSDALNGIASHSYKAKPSDAIHGTGYVVQSLEAALWCFATTDDFRSAVLAAANLGDDADTTAAICGQLAGAHYGEEGIPGEWLAKLAMRAAITDLADRLHGMTAAESRA
ncbi:MAG: ADP-ribosylglycohydrolase family protein, partial [Myxococcales bacterium]|nr:ADP-ribosylglycohydrolase family protein [Myxococcales bacterium]